ncbi:heterokaryon incompatibility protein-domain-containing protein [Xylariaceae sp. FL1651]|nr:heterokaryon incompatibility protein-domain-containing protein [Xylariaceae sp. FL1651]
MTSFVPRRLAFPSRFSLIILRVFSNVVRLVSNSKTSPSYTSLHPTRMSFTYDHSLGSHELRLLQVTKITDQRLSFRVLRTPRTNASYTAISYTWGDEAESETVYLNNQPVSVRPNLWSCLYYISSFAGDLEWRYIWVDALCINQANDEERNNQVREMDRTYRDAVCVSVWLGLVPSLFDWGDSMVELANRPYWSRVWVIQEYLLGRNIELYCGNDRIHWQYFHDMLCTMAGIEEFYDTTREPPRGRGENALAAIPLITARHMDKYPENLQPLCDLLIDHSGAQCKDPRDRVFALLGLVARDERQVLNKCFPNYSLSVDHVRIMTLAHIMYFPGESRMTRAGVEITADSEKLFLGLGVKSKSERSRLLRRAQAIGYLSPWMSSQVPDFLVDQDLEEEYGLVGSVEPQFRGIEEPSRFLRVMRYVLSTLVVATVIIGLRYWQRPRN